jgi:hypothetical protein
MCCSSQGRDTTCTTYLRELAKPNKAYIKIKLIQGIGSPEKYASTAV